MTRLSIVLLTLAACGGENHLSGIEVPPAELSLDTPAKAAWLPVGATEAAGHALGLGRIEVNGQTATLQGEQFTAPISVERGINLLEARGNDTNGDAHYVRQAIIAGDFADPGHPIDNGADLRVNRTGLDRLGELVGTMVDAETVNAAAAAMNPVYEDSYGLWGWDAVNIRADIWDLAFDTPSVSTRPASGVLSAEIRIPNLDVWLVGSGDIIGLDFDVDFWMYAETAVITGQVTVDAVDGKLKVDLRNTAVELEGFWFDTSLLPGEIEVWLLEDTVRSQVEKLLVEQIDAQVPALLEETLGGLDLSFETDLLERHVAIEATFADAWVDPDGLALTMDIDVDMPSQGDFTYAGYLTAPAADPDPDRTSDLSAAIFDDLLNRVLFEAWRSGVVAFDLSTEDGSLEPIMLVPLKATQGAIHIQSALPPVIVERGGRLEAQLGEVDVQIDTPDGQLGSSLLLSLTAFVEVDLKIADGQLLLELGTPELHMMVRDSDWGASPEAITQLVEEMLPIDVMLSLLGDISFPVPAFQGVEIASATAHRDPSGVHTGLSIELR